MELACVGKADQHFIGAPSHSLFRQQHHQHGNFSVDWCVKDPFRGTGRTMKATISKEGDLLIGGMIVVTSTDGSSDMTADGDDSTCRLLIGNQCIQTVETEPITEISRETNSKRFVDVESPNDHRYDRNILGVDFFFMKKNTPMWLHTDQAIQVELEIDNDTLKKHSENDVSVHFQSFQVYLPQNERIPPSMQHLPIQVKQSIEYNEAEIQPGSPLRLTLPFNLPISKLRHGLKKSSFDNNSGLDVIHPSVPFQFIIVRVYVNNNLRFEGKPNEINAIASLFFESKDAILFAIPSQDGYPDPGAFNMSRADTVEIEFEFDTDAAKRMDNYQRDKKDIGNNTIMNYITNKAGGTMENYSRSVKAYGFNILQYQNGKYSLLYSD